VKEQKFVGRDFEQEVTIIDISKVGVRSKVGNKNREKWQNTRTDTEGTSVSRNKFR
jgi:hypothetical protein